MYRKIGETMKTIKPDQIPMHPDEYKLNTEIQDFIKKIDIWNQLKYEYDAHRKHVQKLKKEEMNTKKDSVMSRLKIYKEKPGKEKALDLHKKLKESNVYTPEEKDLRESLTNLEKFKEKFENEVNTYTMVT